jgi:hypothetical protein
MRLSNDYAMTVENSVEEDDHSVVSVIECVPSGRCPLGCGLVSPWINTDMSK